MGRRIRELENLEQMLMQLMFNVTFLSLPMAEAIRRTASSQSGEIRIFMEHITGLMDMFPHITAEEAWQESVRYCGYSSVLCAEDISVLNAFAQNLGQGDANHVKNAIQLTLARIKINIEQAREKKQKDGRLCKSMGFLCGILVVLVLA